MKLFTPVVALCACMCAAAQENTCSSVLTYMTLSSGKVLTTSTTFSDAPCTSTAGAWDEWTSPSATPTSYAVNSSALAYPTFPSIPANISLESPAPGLLNATELLLGTGELISFNNTVNATTCTICQELMAGVAARMKVQQQTLADIATPFCTALSATGLFPFPICVGLLTVASNDIGGIFPAANMTGQDGQLLCAFFFGVCSLPPVPKLDLQTLFKNTTKPPAKNLQPSGKTPLKVLHLSDYHLDLRYVVGAEASCGAVNQLCCRVFPYTNHSVPINNPASIFGNYLCDTPEALGTSVFRAIPEVTGSQVEDFAFAIYTGDLVSHDLWELTQPYVLTEELASYQQFFDGLGNVPVYNTLGNHDTFPHAFNAFPNQNGILPYNASYPVQELWNYEAVSAAWQNYGWLSAADAAEVVNSGLGIYRTLTKEGLVIISLNSDVWYTDNLYAFIQGNVADHSGMFSMLIDYLIEAEQADQPVWIIQHVPTGGGSEEALPAPSDLWYAIVDRFNGTIRGTFFGHTHTDEFSVIYSNNATVQNANTAAGVAWIGPSVTPFTNYNAGFRYYLVDPVTFQVMDSINYYANVSNTNQWEQQGEVTWEFEYSARETYNYDGRWPADQPLNAAFWHSVAEDIATNTTTFNSYNDLRTKKFRPFTPPTGLARNESICGLFSFSIPIFENCIGTLRSTNSMF